MRIERRAPAIGVGGVVGDVGLRRSAVEGRTGVLHPPDDRFLFREGRAVPELHEHADDPHDLVRATRCPLRLAVVARDPHEAVHRGVAREVEVGGAVLEPHQVPYRRLTGPGGVVAVEAVEHPVEHERSAGSPHQLPEREHAHIRRVGGDRQEQVAVCDRGIEPVVGQERHLDELARSAIGEAVAGVEQ